MDVPDGIETDTTVNQPSFDTRSTDSSSENDQFHLTTSSTSKVLNNLEYNKCDDAFNRQSVSIARELARFLTSSYCFICSKNGKGHFKAAPHRAKVFEWIGRKIKNKLVLKEQIYCEACNFPLTNIKLVENHYFSSDHIRIAKTYCFTCKKNVGSEAVMNKHLESKQHKRNSIKHPIIHQREKDSTENGTTHQNIYFGTMETSNDIAQKLRNELRSTFCGICHMDVNALHINHHYLQKDHVLAVRSWMDQEIRHSKEDVDRKLIYCEACFLGLCGTSDAIGHYKNASHIYNEKTYCALCICRGTPSEIEDHNKSKHAAANRTSLLKTHIFRELTKLLDKVYYSRTIPMQRSLENLRILNQRVANLLKADIVPNNANNNQIHSEMKLSMELTRLKKVLNNRSLIPLETAVCFAHKLNQLLNDDNILKESRFVDAAALFEMRQHPEDLKEEEMKENVNKTLMKLEEMSNKKDDDVQVEVILNFVMELNIYLESLMQ